MGIEGFVCGIEGFVCGTEGFVGNLRVCVKN